MVKKSETKKSLKRILIGTVEKISGKNTVKVKIEQKFPHSKYGKIVKLHKKYLAHVEDSMQGVKVGSVVTIRECKPVSKLKRWEVISVS